MVAEMPFGRLLQIRLHLSLLDSSFAAFAAVNFTVVVSFSSIVPSSPDCPDASGLARRPC